LLKEFLVYGLGDLLLRAATVITMPIYTRLLTTADYGIWSYIVTAVGLITSVLALGGDSAYARYFFEVKTVPEKQAITSTWTIFLGVWSSVVVLCCLPLLGWFATWSFGSSETNILFVLALLTAPVGLVNQLCGQVLRNQFRAQLFAGLNIVTTVLIIGFSLIGAGLFQLGLTGILGGTLVATLCMLPVRLWSARAMLRPVFSWHWLRRLLSYGVPLVPVSLAYWIFVVSDRLVIGKLSTVEQLGLYAIANNMTSTLTYINGALGQAWSPRAVQIYEEQRATAPAFYGQVMTYILLGFGFLCVALTTFAREALVILSTPPYYAAAAAVGPLALAGVAFATTQITALSISLVKKTYYITLYSWIAALLNLGLNMLWVPRWGMVAASWTTALAYVFLTGVYWYTSQRLWPVVYETRRVVTIVGLTLLFTLGAPLLPEWSLLISLLAKVVYLLLYVGCLIALRAADVRAWHLLRTVVMGKVGTLFKRGAPAPAPQDTPGVSS
jgi:O-antigen/teichoic acid export membrane protein